MGIASQIPAQHIAVAKNDAGLGFTTVALYIGTAGDLTVKDTKGVVVTYKGASGYIPGQFTAVMAATLAADIVALY